MNIRHSLVVLGVAAIALGAFAGLASVASSATTTNLSWVYVGSTRWRNYDFTNQTDVQTGVDWPVDMYYYNNASVSKIKSVMQDFLPCQTGNVCASYLYMHLSTNSGSTYSWSTSAGMKQSLSACTPSTDLHQRLYAPGGTSFYNTSWGHYVIATTHFDYQEFCHGWSGKSETAEQVVCTDINAEYTRNGQNGHCWYDAGSNLNNSMANKNVSGHWWMNDGKASVVLTP